MKKVIILGSPGAGKTTFARKLQSLTGLPLYHLDLIWHKPDRTHISRDEFDEKLQDIISQDQWIIDGNYSRTHVERIKACDTVFLLDFPLDVCLKGAEERIGKKRPDMPWLETEFDPEFKQWIIDFSKDQLPIIYESIEKYGKDRTIIIFKTREEIDSYIDRYTKGNNMKIPYIEGNWKILFKPEKYGNYINDHTIIKANDGKWHLFGITGFGGGSFTERYFAHGLGDDLYTPMTEVKKTIDTGTLAWAPCVIEKDDNYYMFYGPSPTRMAVSFDMFEWFGYNINMKNEPPMAAHRDHFVLKTENEYLMYVSGVHNKKGAVSLFSSKDLLNWEFNGFALTSGDDAPLKCGWGAMESPYVITKDGLYYLFITYTDCSNETYNNTLVFVSDDPKSFGEYNGGKGGALPITQLYAHAPEILNIDNNYYITTCGWNGKPNPNPGTVSIAHLNWKE